MALAPLVVAIHRSLCQIHVGCLEELLRNVYTSVQFEVVPRGPIQKFLDMRIVLVALIALVVL